jgi:elongation factor 1 alpha-like protein
MHKHEQESKKLGKQSFMYAWVLDETGEERARGITMDVGSSRFDTLSKQVSVYFRHLNLFTMPFFFA